MDRTCRQCGTTWHVNSDDMAALKRNNTRRTGASLQTLGSMGFAGGGGLAAAEVERSRIEARLEEQRHCPACGSQDYDQVEVKWSRGQKDRAKAARCKQYIRDQKALGRTESGLELNIEFTAMENRSQETATIPDASITPSGTRICPFCAEEIKSAAIKCKHCGSAVEPVAEPGSASDSDSRIAAGWYADPLQRHEHRYWDGSTWTPHVADAGRTAHDPL